MVGSPTRDAIGRCVTVGSSSLETRGLRHQRRPRGLVDHSHLSPRSSRKQSSDDLLLSSLLSPSSPTQHLIPALSSSASFFPSSSSHRPPVLPEHPTWLRSLPRRPFHQPAHWPRPTSRAYIMADADPQSAAALQAVMQALESLYKNPDKEAKDAANSWLQDFQKTPEAWQTANSLLLAQDLPLEPRLFAAQTFRTKVGRFGR